MATKTIFSPIEDMDCVLPTDNNILSGSDQLNESTLNILDISFSCLDNFSNVFIANNTLTTNLEQVNQDIADLSFTSIECMNNVFSESKRATNLRQPNEKTINIRNISTASTSETADKDAVNSATVADSIPPNDSSVEALPHSSVVNITDNMQLVATDEGFLLTFTDSSAVRDTEEESQIVDAVLTFPSGANDLIPDNHQTIINDNESTQILDEVTGEFIHPLLDETTGEFVFNIVRDTSTDTNLLIKPTRKHWPEGHHISTKRLTARENRLFGKSYDGFVKNKDNHVTHTKEKYERNISPRCKHNISNISSYHCSEFSDDLRQERFNEFWQVPNWTAKQFYVRGLVSVKGAVQRRQGKHAAHNSRRMVSKACYLANSQGEKIMVCRDFFLSTLALGHNQFQAWTSQYPAAKKKKSNLKPLFETRKNMVKDWLETIPKVPSHYCRASSKKVYVESAFQSYNKMYKVYAEYARERSKNPVSRQVFTEILINSNIEIHHPHKNQCDTCVGHDTGNVSEEDYQLHLKRKDEGRNAKNATKQSCGPDHVVITVDLQSVLLCPRMQASTVYYKQKLQLHNFTVYRLNDKDATLYVWHEGEGNVTSNKFVSCIADYIHNLSVDVKKVTIISDGCTYQNRNKCLSSFLSDVAKSNDLEIQQIILERGHTMLEADSVHSTLDGLFKNAVLYTPDDYISLMRNVRVCQPYNVKVVNHTFFKNFDALPTNFISIRPGKKAGDPVVTDIRALKYLSNGNVYFKLSLADNWAEHPCKRNTATRRRILKADKLYSEPINISKEKFDSLQSLKPLMPWQYHAFYDSLCHI